MESVQLMDRHRDKVVEVRRIDERRGELAHGHVVGEAIVTHDRVDHLGELLAVAEPKRIWLRQRVPRDGIALARALARPARR
ncbi:MAG TPA: hypothetical protein VNO30_03725 [Kofleriaceae bacterium]|nr:hypothetical protein [Kofleriaceae bacterium]